MSVLDFEARKVFGVVGEDRRKMPGAGPRRGGSVPGDPAMGFG
jgi:hypothetical protein